jgi:hypothetical protein
MAHDAGWIGQKARGYREALKAYGPMNRAIIIR